MKVSNDCLKLVKKWEGFYSKAYLCPANVWTVGYGTTKWANGKAVKPGDTITESEAVKLLEKQVNEHASTIEQYVTVKLSQSQFDALASFQYNLGKHILKGSKLLRCLNAKQWDQASNLMLEYCKARDPKTNQLKVLKGLQNRRKEEVQLFMKGAEDELDFKNDDLESIYNMRITSKATKELLIAGAKKHLNINKNEISDGDLIALALELSVKFLKQ